MKLRFEDYIPERGEHFSLSTWTHPTSKEVRVYVNNSGLTARGDDTRPVVKIWISKVSPSTEVATESDWVVNVYTDHKTLRMPKESAREWAEQAMIDMGISTGTTFADIVSQVEAGMAMRKGRKGSGVSRKKAVPAGTQPTESKTAEAGIAAPVSAPKPAEQTTIRPQVSIEDLRARFST